MGSKKHESQDEAPKEKNSSESSAKPEQQPKGPGVGRLVVMDKGLSAQRIYEAAVKMRERVLKGK